MMLGMFPVADHPAVMLFDSGASHTFINRTFVIKHEIPIGRVGSTCYNIPDLSTQGTNQVGTSHLEAAPAGNGDVQALQGLSEQTLGISMNRLFHGVVKCVNESFIAT